MKTGGWESIPMTAPMNMDEDVVDGTAQQEGPPLDIKQRMRAALNILVMTLVGLAIGCSFVYAKTLMGFKEH